MVVETRSGETGRRLEAPGGVREKEATAGLAKEAREGQTTLLGRAVDQRRNPTVREFESTWAQE